ncbi:MAG: HNH endonuclease signature motif containing protein [Sedimentisphaerales bacterium]
MKKLLSFLLLVLVLSVCTSIIAKGSNSGKHLVGGSGSSHKGGHYEGGSSSIHSYSDYSSVNSGIRRRSYSSSLLTKHIKYNHILTAIGVARDSHGKIERSESAKEEFLKEHGLTKVPPGYEVDHRIPLYAGGSDTPDNMQLLSKSQHHDKTKADFRRYGR